MLNLNINKKDDKYKNLFNQGIEFVYDEDIATNVSTNAVDNEEEVKEDVKEDKKPNKKKKPKPHIKKHNTEYNPLRSISDKQGLERAYKNNDNNIYVEGDTMYVSGTKHADSIIDTVLDHSYDNIQKNIQSGRYQDVWDDLKLPFHQTFKTERYKNVQDELDRNPNIKNVIGHSLGGAVAYEAQARNPKRDLNVTTYSAPLISKPGDKSAKNRYRNMFDPISILDKSAHTSVNIGNDFYNPHSFSNTSNNNYTSKQPTPEPIYQGVGNVLPPEQRLSVNTAKYINANTRILFE